jgi:AcrR family transcriptional regulator
MGDETPQGTREEILDTALHLFTVQGYDATSLRQIADQLGFTKAALYYHFPAKEHLVIELARPWLDAISNLITLHQRDRSDQQQLLSDYLDIFLAHHTVVRFITMDPVAQNHPDVGMRIRTLVMALQTALAGPDADTADRVRVLCALSAVHGVAGMDAASVAVARPIVIAAAASILEGISSPTPS